MAKAACAITPRRHTCRECGVELTGMRRSAVFCSPEHRKAWNNRRMVRGAEMYDIYMAMAYERGKRKQLELFTTLNRLARAYRDADCALRDGRKSWNVEETLARLPIAYSTEGDQR